MGRSSDAEHPPRLRVREAARRQWIELPRSGRIAVAGVVASAALAVVLGVILPRVVEQEVLASRLESVSSLVRVFEQEGLTPPIGDHLEGEQYRSFDGIVRDGLLGGDNVRVKLWNTSGEIVYSDELRLVGRRFEVGPQLQNAFSGVASIEVSDLTDDENFLDHALGERLLEFYVPLHADGAVVGVFEIYQDFSPLQRHLATVRAAVWIAVGSGLTVLLVFLILLFSATARAMDRERAAAVARADDLAVLLRVSEILSSRVDIDETAAEVLRLLIDRLGLRCAGLIVPGEAGEVVVSDDADPDACDGVRSLARSVQAGDATTVAALPVDSDGRHTSSGSGEAVLAVPFSVEPELPGALVVCRDVTRPFDAREEAVVAGVAGQLGVAVVSATLFRDLGEMTKARGALLRRLVDAQEEERKHLVGDLHDGAGQTLTRVLYGLRGSRSRLDPEDHEVSAELARLEGLVDDLIVDLRRYMSMIQPAMIEDLGLGQAIESFARGQEDEAGISIRVRVAELPALDAVTAVTLYRATQEAVMNARKHSGASGLDVRVSHDGHIVTLEVRDDGVGADVLEEGMGLSYLRDRVESLGGAVAIRTRPGEGTVVKVEVPVG